MASTGSARTPMALTPAALVMPTSSTKDPWRKTSSQTANRLDMAGFLADADAAEGAVIGRDVDVAPRRALEVGAHRPRAAQVVGLERRDGDVVLGVLLVEVQVLAQL